MVPREAHQFERTTERLVRRWRVPVAQRQLCARQRDSGELLRGPRTHRVSRRAVCGHVHRDADRTHAENLLPLGQRTLLIEGLVAGGANAKDSRNNRPSQARRDRECPAQRASVPRPLRPGAS